MRPRVQPAIPSDSRTLAPSLPSASPLVLLADGPASATTDPGCLARLRAGDLSAFEAVFRAAAPGLVVFATRYVTSRAIAEEIVQDVLFRVWERRATLAVPGTLASYLYAATRNAAIDQRRALTAEQARVAAVAGVEEAIEWPRGDAEVREAELARAVADAIQTLPARCREVFTLTRRDRLTYAETATRLGISVKTVETYVARALVIIRNRLRRSL